MKKLQAEWQAGRPRAASGHRVVWKRFRDACDKFFTRRNEDLAQRKEVWSANQAKKEALCARAEELAESRDWEKRRRRRCAACRRNGRTSVRCAAASRRRSGSASAPPRDTFFDRYKRRDEIEIESRQADREALVTELEAMIQPCLGEPGEAAPAERPRPLATCSKGPLAAHALEPATTAVCARAPIRSARASSARWSGC